MQTTQDFTGLGMPVFTAFGWAGEEAAIQYALSQLEGFVMRLNSNMPAVMRKEVPFYGLSKETNSAFLAAGANVDDDLYVAFNARPTSLEIQLGLSNKNVLAKGYKLISKDLDGFSNKLLALGADWNLRVQQLLINEETGESGHYQDLFKDDLGKLDLDSARELLEKAAYLNSETKWVTPVYLSQRIPAEQVSAMGLAVIDVVVEKLKGLLPVIIALRGRKPAKKTTKRTKTKKKATKKKAKIEQPAEVKIKANATEFEYVAELKPLHVRRGFINLTAQHWPFFALNARTETREIIVLTDDVRHSDCAVWRLQPHNIARLVLGAKAHAWLEDNFAPGDLIQLKASKEEKKIEVTLQAPLE